jgi:hypothetical protein
VQCSAVYDACIPCRGHGAAPHSYSALHCTALHCTALHCTALLCIALHCSALHCTALHCTALHCTALHWGNVTVRGGLHHIMHCWVWGQSVFHRREAGSTSVNVYLPPANVDPAPTMTMSQKGSHWPEEDLHHVLHPVGVTLTHLKSNICPSLLDTLHNSEIITRPADLSVSQFSPRLPVKSCRRNLLAG